VLDSTDKIEVVQAPEAAPDNPDDAGGESAQPAIVLSPSAVGTLLECPRRYFLSRRAAAERPGSQSLVLGTLMHSLLEQAQLERMSALPPPAGQPGFFADLELRAVGELRRRWGELEYPVRWQSAAKLSQAEAMLRRYFAWEQRSAAAGVEIEAVERPFELTLELFGVVVALPGKIDRVEIAGGKRRVVDFKTGQPLLQAEVAASDQLGIYQLALARDTGPTAVAGAGMVFLGKQNKEGLPVEYGQAGLAVLPKRFVLPPAVLLADPPPELRRELRARAEGAEEEPQIAGPFNWVELRAMLAAVVVAQGSYPAVENAKCGRCPFRDSCPIRDEGEQLC
jgi:RecB family exonuclease